MGVANLFSHFKEILSLAFRGRYTPPCVPGGILEESRESQERPGNPCEFLAFTGTSILLEVFPCGFLIEARTIPSIFPGRPGIGQE